MHQQTIDQLNQLNKDFYQTVGQAFDRTRHAPWLGWQKCISHIDQHFIGKDEISVLDVGCGNGRFGLALQEQSAKEFTYTGIESDEYLLHKAKSALSSIKVSFLHADIMDFNFEELSKTDVAVLFGVIHHIPSFEKRRKLLLQLSEVLNKDGLLCISAWQFPQLKKFAEKKVAIEKIPSIDPQDLEDGDYFLGWDQHSTAIRYCHHVDEQELEKLIDTTVLQPVEQWYDDGSNLYAIFQKK